MSTALARRVGTVERGRPEKGEEKGVGNTLKPPVDLLAQAVERTRPLLADATKPTKKRVRILWAAAKAARDLGAIDVVTDAFAQLSVDVGLIDGTGRWTGADARESARPFGKQDIAHVISWALRGLNPFDEGPLT